ncbi:MAG: molybdopterin-binding protein [Acidimicrobiales bacterium]
MARYRIGEAADALGVTVDTLRRWVDTGRVASVRTAGGQRVIESSALAALAVELGRRPREASTGQSARNRLPGVVTAVVRDGVMAQVELQAGAHRIVSLMTREAADELGLAPGVLAVATVKATAVVVERRDRR